MKEQWDFIYMQDVPGSLPQYNRLVVRVSGEDLSLTVYRAKRPTGKKGIEHYTIHNFRKKTVTDVLLSAGNLVYNNFFSNCVRQVYISLRLKTYTHGREILPKG